MDPTAFVQLAKAIGCDSNNGNELFVAEATTAVLETMRVQTVRSVMLANTDLSTGELKSLRRLIALNRYESRARIRRRRAATKLEKVSRIFAERTQFRAWRWKGSSAITAELRTRDSITGDHQPIRIQTVSRGHVFYYQQFRVLQMGDWHQRNVELRRNLGQTAQTNALSTFNDCANFS